jgi:hypothetical protein
MRTRMEDDIKRGTAKRKAALVMEMIQGKTTVSEASRSFDLPPSEIEEWVDEGGVSGIVCKRGGLLWVRAGLPRAWIQLARRWLVQVGSWLGSFCQKVNRFSDKKIRLGHGVGIDEGA